MSANHKIDDFEVLDITRFIPFLLCRLCRRMSVADPEVAPSPERLGEMPSECLERSQKRWYLDRPQNFADQQ